MVASEQFLRAIRDYSPATVLFAKQTTTLPIKYRIKDYALRKDNFSF